jgi:hypothetical protein
LLEHRILLLTWGENFPLERTLSQIEARWAFTEGSIWGVLKMNHFLSLRQELTLLWESREPESCWTFPDEGAGGRRTGL